MIGTFVTALALGVILIDSVSHQLSNGSDFSTRVINTAAVKSYTSQQKGWALAASAFLAEGNNESYDYLAGGERTSEHIKGYKALLSNWWGIENRNDLLSNIEALEATGHRSDFESLGRRVDSLTSEQYEEMLSRYSNDAERRHELEMVRKYYRTLSSKGILAWDYCRIINLCRWGYMVGYITEDEAWAKMIPAAQKLQQTYDSWKEMGEAYLIGREFWSWEQTQKNGDKYREIYQSLLTDQRSVWNQYSWNENLTAIR